MKEVIAGIVISLAIVSFPAGMLWACQKGWERGRDEERQKLVCYGLGRYVFSPGTGKADFQYGSGSDSWTFQSE